MADRLTITNAWEVRVPADKRVLQQLPHPRLTDVLGMSAEGGDVVARIGGVAGPFHLRAGEHVTLNGAAGHGGIELRSPSGAWVHIVVGYTDEPSAIDQLGDLARDRG